MSGLMLMLTGTEAFRGNNIGALRALVLLRKQKLEVGALALALQALAHRRPSCWGRCEWPSATMWLRERSGGRA